jgi:hypothetical protein
VMTESIVVIRLLRNLRYKLTYIKIFEEYMDSNPGPDLKELLDSLIRAQQTAIGPLSSYLRRLDVNTQDLDLDEKLMGHATSRDNIGSQLRFIYEGLSRAVSWYKMQLVDKQMTADQELKQLLLELGEIDATQLWRTEATMAMLGIPTKPKQKDYSDQRRPDPNEIEGWRPRLVEDVSGSTWEERPPRWQQPPSYRRGDRWSE